MYIAPQPFLVLQGATNFFELHSAAQKSADQKHTFSAEGTATSRHLKAETLLGYNL